MNLFTDKNSALFIFQCTISAPSLRDSFIIIPLLLPFVNTFFVFFSFFFYFPYSNQVFLNRFLSLWLCYYTTYSLLLSILFYLFQPFFTFFDSFLPFYNIFLPNFNISYIHNKNKYAKCVFIFCYYSPANIYIIPTAIGTTIAIARQILTILFILLSNLIFFISLSIPKLFKKTF